MTIELPDAFWDRVRAEIEALSPGPASRQQALLRQLVAGFTDGRLGARYLDRPEMLAAYVRAFVPQEVRKVPEVLERVRGEIALLLDAAGGALRVADCGAGPASASLGLVGWLPRRAARVPRLDVTLCDRSRAAVALGSRLLQELAARLDLSLDVRLHDGLLPVAGGYHLLLLQNALAEAGADDAAAEAILRSALRLLDAHGLLVVIEPADRDRSRRLLGARDRLLAVGAVRVVAPCTRQGGCPALQAGDWCSFEEPLSLPRAARLGLREEVFPRRALKWSYLVMARGDATEEPGTMRLVGPVRHGGGGHEALACGPAGRLRLRLLKRHVREGNAPFRRLRWGDRLRLEPPLQPAALERSGHEGGLADIGPDVAVLRDDEGPAPSGR